MPLSHCARGASAMRLWAVPSLRRATTSRTTTLRRRRRVEGQGSTISRYRLQPRLGGGVRMILLWFAWWVVTWVVASPVAHWPFAWGKVEWGAPRRQTKRKGLGSSVLALHYCSRNKRVLNYYFDHSTRGEAPGFRKGRVRSPRAPVQAQKAFGFACTHAAHTTPTRQRTGPIYRAAGPTQP